MKPNTIAIVGLGLMGGSLAAACRRKFPNCRIVGISRKRSAIRYAAKKKWIHEGFRDLGRGIQDADFIILCTPLDTFKRYLINLDRHAKPGTVVTDVGSAKGQILSWTDRKKFQNVRFVGAHPMVGSHRRGIQAGQPKLYDQGYTFLVRGRHTCPKSYAVTKSFWRKIMPRVVEVKPDEHDRIVAMISHLPHAVSLCLVLAVPRKFLSFASSGFSDTTRVVQGDPSIWLPIFTENRKSLQKSLLNFEKEWHQFKKALLSCRTQSLRRLLVRGRRKRIQISL